MNMNLLSDEISDAEYFITDALHRFLKDTKNSSTRKLTKDNHIVWNSVNELLYLANGTLMSESSIDLLATLKKGIGILNVRVNNLACANSCKSVRTNSRRIRKIIRKMLNVIMPVLH